MTQVGAARAFNRKTKDLKISEVGSEDWLVHFSSLLLLSFLWTSICLSLLAGVFGN